MHYQNLIRSAPILALLLLLSSCSLLPTITVSKAEQKAAPTHQEQPILVPHRPYITAEARFDITSSCYPSPNFTNAVNLVAQSIDQAVQPNQDGAVIYISWLSHNSFDSESTVMVITIPALPADPPAPALVPPPSPTGDPYTDEQNKQHVQEENTARIASWQQILRAKHARLASVRKTIKAQTDQLRRLAPPVDTLATDIHGALERASLRFQQSQAGKKYLFLESDMVETTTDETVGTLSLTGVYTWIIFHPCDDASGCLGNDSYWRGVLVQAGVRDLHILDPGQSETIQSLFS